MESQNKGRSFKLISVVIVFGIILSTPFEIIAQQTHGENEHPPHIQKKIEQLQNQFQDKNIRSADSPLMPRKSGVDLQTMNSEYTVLEFDDEWRRSSNPNPEHNFRLFGQGQPAGNINGDSSGTGNPIDDYIVTSTARDENTSALEDQIWKTAVFYGDNTSGTPDQLIPRRLIPVGDLNGDGYADAVASEVSFEYPSPNNNGQAYIYEGTQNDGFINTFETIPDGFNPSQRQIAFHDLNRDGYDDVLSYNPNNEDDIVVVWGSAFFNEITLSSLSGVLTPGVKQLAVADVDKDGVKEIVELSGEAGYNGQLQILEVGTLAQTLADGITIQQIFSFSDFNFLATQNDLHLLDINGNGNHEIYISEGRTGPKHVIEFDSLLAAFSTTSTEIFSGTLVPAGDLNNDGKHDFIMGDDANNDAPYIAYGKDDFTSLSLDVPLNGNGGTEWSWNMNYNPNSWFGDFNGDGTDDVLMEHFSQDAGNQIVGRRILRGNESEAYSSEFHQYPLENYFSSVLETEEVGDVNGDGIEDFAMSYYYQQKVEIYFGGSSLSGSPDETIDLDYSPAGITGGDFNDDGYSDIIISTIYGDDSALMFIYFGGSSLSDTPDKIIDASDFQSVAIPGLFNPKNVGDVNNDGIDDFLVGSSGARGDDGFVNDAYLFYGGNSISETPDRIISLAPTGNYIWAGEGSAALGDINGDGIDDFAVSAPALPNENDRFGQVHIYFGGSSPSFSNPDIILHGTSNVDYFGWGIAAGDFTGDGVNDVAVTSEIYFGETGIPGLLHIYKGGTDMNTSPDKSLAFPDFMLEYDTGDDVLLPYNFAQVEVIPDFTNDGKDELLFGTYFSNSHAAIYLFDKDQPLPELAVKAPNRAAGLGGFLGMAVGDFTDNGQTDLILTQAEDNNEAYRSSRVYRYEMPIPIEITSVEDVPDDQGGKVHLHLGGIFMDAIFQENIYGFDEVAVQYMDDNDEWVWKGGKQPAPLHDSAKYLEVDGLTTQPSNTDEVDNSYLFRVALLKDNEPVVISDPTEGAAFDNLAPLPIQNIQIDEQDGTKLLSWSPSGDGDIGEYLVYEADANGEQSGNILGKSTEPEFALSGSFEGIQNFAVKARDVNNNLGEASTPATAIFPQTIDYDMREGWNLIGLPVDTDVQTIQSALQAAESSAIYEYDGGYTEVDMLEAGKGYWAKFSMADLYQLQGLPFTELTVDLKEGWNLISGVAEEHPVTAIRDSDGIVLQETVFAFDQAYTATDTLRPGNGYWIRASSSGTVTLIHPKLDANRVEISDSQKTLAKDAEKIEDKFGTLTISDGEHSRTLYFGAQLPDHINKLQYSLPPLPPGDVFDVRFMGDTRLTEKSEANIKLSRIEGTALKLKLDTQNLTEQNRFVVKEFADDKFLSEYKVNSDEEFNLKNSETNAIYLAPAGNSISQNQIPEEFKLEQNYPNPFNPTTQIKYSVTEASEVTLEVFNILGRRVATLINSKQQPGNYEVTFDGSNLASGVYLYRLQAGSNISTKKFILAK